MSEKSLYNKKPLSEKTFLKRDSEGDKIPRGGKNLKIENSWEKQNCQTQSLFVTEKGKQWKCYL